MILMILLLGSLSLAEAVEYSPLITNANLRHPADYLESDRLLKFDECHTSTEFERIDLSGLDIFGFGRSSFSSYCFYLKTLDLSANWISEIPEGFFSKNMPSLEHLSLANNDLGGKGWKGAFRGLTKLKTLNITHNPLSRILDDENFAGLPNSCEIHMGGSKNFRTITPLAFGSPKKLDQKNHTSANESKNCPDSLIDRIEMFEIERSWVRFGKGNEERYKLNDEPYSDDDVKMCTDSATVRLVNFSNITDTLSPNCHKILMNDNRTKLKIYDKIITSFDSGWFRLQNTSVNAVYVYPEKFENLTSDLLNDLPENIRFFSLQESGLQSLDKGVMVNEHLRGLDLSANFIRFIEEDAFAGMNLTRLNLGYNPLVTLDYVSTLPETLLWLNLEYTGIGEIPENTFSRLKNLLALNLVGSDIVELRPPSLDGLVSLRSLDLAVGHIKNLRPDVFRDLSALYYLDLSRNDIERLERGVFNGLGCLAKLYFTGNNLTRLDGGSFEGLTDSLEALNLDNNELEILEAGTFVGAPKFNLSLGGNMIHRIEKGVFNLPYLRYLDLRNNNLTKIDKGAAKNLGNLANEIEIKLGFNPIERLDNGALAGLPNKAYVNLASTPMKIIQAGVFDDQ